MNAKVFVCKMFRKKGFGVVVLAFGLRRLVVYKYMIGVQYGKGSLFLQITILLSYWTTYTGQQLLSELYNKIQGKYMRRD